MPQKERLKNLFKTGDKVTQANMADLIENTNNDVTEMVIADEREVTGFRVCRVNTGNIYNYWVIGQAPANKTYSSDSRHLLASVEDFPELEKYQGDPADFLMFTANTTGSLDGYCSAIEVDETGFYFIAWGGTFSVSTGQKMRATMPLILGNAE